jgi:alpha-glucosidase (family GH31 glycosyl hydrolase)
LSPKANYSTNTSLHCFTPWTGVVPITHCLQQEPYSVTLPKNLLNVGVSGYKMDENDGYDEWLWPDVTTFPSGHSAEQMRQLYGVMMQKMTTELYRKKSAHLWTGEGIKRRSYFISIRDL